MKFNKEQLKVINNIKENIYLLAPAGTGKTMVLSKRILKIIEEGNSSEDILCITFTRKACKELEDRVTSVLKEKSRGLTIRTFHSFCLDVIRDMAKKKTDNFKDFVVYDEYDALEIVKRFVVVKNKKGDVIRLSDVRLQKCINYIKEIRLKENFFTDDSSIDLARTVKYIFENYYKELENNCRYKENGKWKTDTNLIFYIKARGPWITNAYNMALRSLKALDFIDLITNAKEMFEDEEVARGYRERYKFINIDEMQDTSLSEYKIVEKLFYGNNVLLCGDKFQTIYEWRGSEPAKILEEFEKFSPLKIVFNKNYRSTKLLNDLSVEYLKEAFEDEAKKMYKEDIIAMNEYSGEKIKVIRYENRKKEGIGIIEECNKIKEKDGNLNSVCILTRNNFINKDLSEVIKEQNIKDFSFVLVDQFRFFRRFEIKNILAVLKFILNSSDMISLERIFRNSKNHKIKEKVLSKAMDKEHRKARVKLTDYLDEKSEYGEYYSLLLKANEENNIVVFDVESTGTDVTSDEIIQIAAIKRDKKGNEIAKFEEFIKPKKSVGTSYYVHGFSDEKLLEIGRDKREVFNEFLKFIKGSVIVGHNVSYDLSILESELLREGMENYEIEGFYDTLEIYRRFYAQGMKNYKLDYLSEKFNTNTKPSHNALDDIRATADLLYLVIKDRIVKENILRFSLLKELYGEFDDFRKIFKEISVLARVKRPWELIKEILDRIEFRDENENRCENIEKFIAISREIDDVNKAPIDSLRNLVNVSALSNGDIEELMVKRTGKVRIPIITVHQAKGLEFDNVILAGVEEGVFPSLKGNIDEEKRLFYVAMTRAKKRLILTYSKKDGISRLVENLNFNYVNLIE